MSDERDSITPPPAPVVGAPDEDLQKILAERGGMKWTPVTIALVATLVLGAGFLGGLVVGRHQATTSAAAGGNLPGVGQGFPGGGQGFPGTGTGGGGGGGVTVGTVESVNGGTVTIRTAAGDLVKVTTTGSTPVQVTKSGALSDLTTGSSVVVIGSASSDGTVNATSISEGGGFGPVGGSGASNAPPPSLSP